MLSWQHWLAQLLSEYVAVSLQFCSEEKLPGFEGCEATIKFIRMVDKMFDVLYSSILRCRGFKRLCSHRMKLILFTSCTKLRHTFFHWKSHEMENIFWIQVAKLVFLDLLCVLTVCSDSAVTVSVFGFFWSIWNAFSVFV